MPNKIKIGIPKSLFYYYYTPFWHTLFKELEIKIIYSEDTNKEILDQGLKSSINELCIPIKLLIGHVLNLKNNVDFILLPYYITLEKDSYFCPKLIAAPDIIKANFDDIKLLSPDVNMNNFSQSLYSSLKEMIIKLGINPIKLVNAGKKAIEAQKKFKELNIKKQIFPIALKNSISIKQIKNLNINKKQNVTLAIIGHSYVINDAYISSNIIQKLIDKEINVMTSDMVSSDIIKENITILDKIPHWTLGNAVFGSAIHYSNQKNVDGIIYVTPFGCSSDSLVMESLHTHLKNKKPFMTITVDEHSGDAGLVTRIEAFLDMIIIKKENKKE